MIVCLSYRDCWLLDSGIMVPKIWFAQPLVGCLFAFGSVLSIHVVYT